jgi:hypothetical protein
MGEPPSYEFRPLGLWSGPATPPDERRRSPFKAQYEATLDLVFAEAAKLDATRLVLQVDLQQRDIRVDGLPKAKARFGDHPGVVVSFDSRHGPLRYATDVFDDWRGNLRAIALALENLRAVDRYGVTRRGEQYRGWTAIGSAAPGRGPFADRADAETWMRLAAREAHIGAWADWDGLYRLLAKTMHPDVAGGSADLWERLDAAAGLLGVRRGKSAEGS